MISESALTEMTKPLFYLPPWWVAPQDQTVVYLDVDK